MSHHRGRSLRDREDAAPALCLHTRGGVPPPQKPKPAATERPRAGASQHSEERKGTRLRSSRHQNIILFLLLSRSSPPPSLSVS
eukprot:960755-Rhodomonas_salina.1